MTLLFVKLLNDSPVLRQRLKPWILPLSMLSGLFSYPWAHYSAPITPWLIFAMLLVTFCRVDHKHIRPARIDLILAMIQACGFAVTYLALKPFLGPTVGSGIALCIICPTATAAPVVTGMLGGSVTRVVSYSICSNIIAAIIAPWALIWMGAETAHPLDTAIRIVTPLLTLIGTPLAIALLAGKYAPKVHLFISNRQDISFYLWAVALFMVMGRSVASVIAMPASQISTVIWLAAGAGVVCVAQFVIGRRIGGYYGDPIAAAQSLGQKNTILAIWMALTYLHPVASVAPAAYVAWQNAINSWQILSKR